MLWRMRFAVPTVIITVANNFLYINKMDKLPIPKIV